MTRYHVDSDAVLSTTSSVRAAAERLRSEGAALYGQLVGLQQSWTGPAATAFQTVASEWKATQQRVEESIEQINAALALAGQQYAEVEAQAARMFAR
jgi:6 kDa early secretory antigenic target